MLSQPSIARALRNNVFAETTAEGHFSRSPRRTAGAAGGASSFSDLPSFAVAEAFQMSLRQKLELRRSNPYGRGRNFGIFASLVRPQATLSLTFEISRPSFGFRAKPLEVGWLRINHYYNMHKPRLVVPADRLEKDLSASWASAELHKAMEDARILAEQPVQVSSRQAARMEPSAAAIQALADEAIKLLDTDQDHALNPKEFAMIGNSISWSRNEEMTWSTLKYLDFSLHSLGIWWGPGDDYEALFNSMDSDKDDQLSVAEMSDGLAAAAAGT
eukprot:TRINITY_DN19425_c0_g1_i2.p1 TRINITY_DN19425_c0_g1~~TRINITY_DN19425_c0_g1_i2.p1  ORF type:complete len:273 (-),score=53.89 TRINITY_DN19425_c0_g1_i2:42-860(-)